MARLRRRLLALLVPLTILVVIVAGAILWLDQQSARARIAEAELQPALARADAAEARAARAEASLTAIAQQRVAEAAATSTAVAEANEPQRALERALGRLFAVFEDPTGTGYDQLSTVFSQDALPSVRAEADYLRVRGQHLGGVSTFNVDSSPPNRLPDDRVEIHTRERWVYDERDESDRRQRCFVEDSDQTYTMRLSGQAWIVDQYQLGDTRRSDCPAGA